MEFASTATLFTLTSCGTKHDDGSGNDTNGNSEPKLGQIYEIKGPTVSAKNPQLSGIESHRFERTLNIKLPADMPLRIHTLGYKRACGDVTTQVAGPFVKVVTPEGGALTLNPTSTASGEHAMSSINGKAGDFKFEVYATSDKPCDVELALYVGDASTQSQIPGYGAELEGLWTVNEVRGSYRHKSEWRFFGYGKVAVREYIDENLLSDLEYMVYKNPATNPDQLSLTLTNSYKIPEGSTWKNHDIQNCIFDTNFTASGERHLRLRCAARNEPFFPTAFDVQTRDFVHFVDFTGDTNFIATKDQLNTPIPDDSQTGVSVPFDVIQDFQIQDLQVLAHTDHGRASEIRLYIVSPDSKKVRVSLQRGHSENGLTNLFYTALTSSDSSSKELLATSRSRGTWTLLFTDETRADSGILKDATLRLIRK